MRSTPLLRPLNPRFHVLYLVPVREKVSALIADYIFDYDLPLSPVLYGLLEYQKNMELGSFFFESVEREGVLL